jgi:hypothetical protein
VSNKVRESILNQFAREDVWCGLIVRRPGLVTVESTESHYAQAADIAVGIASDIYANKGLVAVVSHFEYATFNGNRVSFPNPREPDHNS